MCSLTDRVFILAETEGQENDKKILEFLKNELPDDAHIEHILSQLGDRRTIAGRSKNNKATFGDVILDLVSLDELHQRILEWLAETIRWGYKPAEGNNLEIVGSREKPIVTVDDHKNFISAIFNRSQAGVAERRQAVRLFTTNYDTLIEDALAMERFSYWDGFSGGAVAFRSHRYGDNEPKNGYRAHVIKLHGSIDWRLDEGDRVLRIRDGDLYPEKKARIIIYPQSIKYLATQRDPFAAQLELFRRFLASREENVLAICGYSFGDDHINQEIEMALQHSENRTTILAFSQHLHCILDSWLKKPWGKRVYVITENDIFVGENQSKASPANRSKHKWWTFDGVTKIINNGVESFIA